MIDHNDTWKQTAAVFGVGAISLALVVLVGSWLVDVGGWIRAGAGSILAVLGLGYATQLRKP